jgi:hypothetical protein
MKRQIAWESWIGRPARSIAEHPYFKHLGTRKLRNDDDGLETWVYSDQTPFPTGAYCQSLGGCPPTPNNNCHSAFSIRNGEILGFEQTGGCPGSGTIEAQEE